MERTGLSIRMKSILLFTTAGANIIFLINTHVHSFSSHNGSKTKTFRNHEKVRTTSSFKNGSNKERQERQQTRKSINKINFLQKLQTSCHTPNKLLDNVGQHLTINNDGKGRVASLSMIRFSKMLIFKSNAQYSKTYRNKQHRLDDSQLQLIASPQSDLFETSHLFSPFENFDFIQLYLIVKLTELH